MDARIRLSASLAAAAVLPGRSITNSESASGPAVVKASSLFRLPMNPFAGGLPFPVRPTMKTIQPGSIRELLPLALPIFLSQAVDVTMIFCDRLFLSNLGRESLAATLTGGILAYLMSTLLIGTMGQITPLVAQYRGAGQTDRCAHVVHQGLLVALIGSPLLLVAAFTASPVLFSFFGHEQVLAGEETRYFRILSLTVVATSIRQVFASFFVAVGRSVMVTLASVSAVIVNIPLAYGLIFGKWGLPRLGIEGAAIGTVIAGILPIVILVTAFLSPRMRREYNTGSRPVFDTDLLKRLLRYGLPAGFEMLINVAGFFFFTMVMYSFSPDVAAATTIVLNWDMVSFLPLLGISQAVGGLVGKYLGARDKANAMRSAWASLKLGWSYAGFITLVYFAFTETLVGIFTHEHAVNFGGVVPYAVLMLRISCIYFFFDATYAVLGGILKGAGDTLWTMAVSNSLMWTTAFLVYQSKEKLGLTPIGAWIVLTVLVFLLGSLYGVRFLRRRWMNRLMIG